MITFEYELVETIGAASKLASQGWRMINVIQSYTNEYQYPKGPYFVMEREVPAQKHDYVTATPYYASAVQE